MTYEEIITGLRSLGAKHFDDSSDGMSGLARLRQLTGSLMELPAPQRAVPELYAVMERLRGCELGTPGPLVHTLEKMDYVAGLVDSVRRRPTCLSVWMVNRILNSELPVEQRRFYLDLLAAAAEHPESDETVRFEAQHFIDYQAARNP